ncbi:MAG: GNAT family N-acetyltransferase [candidate division KSB1 bacterium]|nr:GNAT family N-acetyltransferase [candidate division KSB1 bacterium]
MDRNREGRGLRIRSFRESDREAVVAITLLAFPGVAIDHAIEERFGTVGGLTWQDRKRRDIERDLDLHAPHTLVAEMEGRVVGYVTSHPDPLSRIGWIPNLAIHPEYQGRGIGRELLEAALEQFRRLGMALAKIETLAHNERALHLYQELGFVEVARQVHLVRPLERSEPGAEGPGV